MARQRRGKITITFTIAATFSVLVIGVVGTVVAVDFFSSRANTVALVAEVAAHNITQVRQGIHNHLDPVAEQGRFVAELIGADDQLNLVPRRLGDTLLAALGPTPQVTALIFIGSDGQVMRAYRGDAREANRIDATPVQDDGFAARTLERGKDREHGFWNEILYSESRGQSYVNHVTPVRRGSEYLGVVLAAVSLSELSLLVSDVGDRLRGTVFILQNREKIIAHPILTAAHPEQTKQTPLVGIDRIGDLILEQFWSAQTLPLAVPPSLTDVELRRATVAGQAHIFVASTMTGYGDHVWTIGGYLDLQTARDALQQVRTSVLVGLGALFLGALMAILLGGAIARPIRRASDAIGRIALLEMQQVEDLPPSRLAELDRQASAFNAMLGGLRWFETYVPRSLVRRLIARGEVHSQEREVTILFTDIVGFTPLSERMRAAETAEFLNHHFALLAQCVEDEGGTIDKFIGDALMAFWGAPDDQPDHVQRALRAARAMARAVLADNENSGRDTRKRIRVRIGLHAGAAVVGNIGSPERMNYTIVGDAVNTAQRVEQLGGEIAPAAEVVILASESVAAAAPIDVETTLVGEFSLKGRARPVAVYRVALD